MNVLQIQDDLKNFSEDQLIKEMQQPSGSAPQFLVLSELNRRKRVKGDFEARQAQQQPTVAQEVVAAAGLPQAGMMGMSEAMAPQSAVSDGVGTNAPMKMASGGLAQFGNDIRQSMSQEIDPYLDGVQQEAEQKFNIDLDQDQPKNIMQLPGPRIPSFGMRPSIRPAIEQVGIGGKGIARPAILERPLRGGPEMFRSQSLRGYADGGVVKAQQGTYFPSNSELLGIYGQESGFGKNLFGSSGEVGPYQIRPTTAISPGYGIQSMFPELAQAVEQGKYKNFQEAYEDNKEMVDAALMSGEKSEAFVTDYLDKAEGKLGSREKALLAYNQGIAGTEKFKGDPSKTDYVSGVKKKSIMYDETPMNSGIMSAQASTLDDKERVDGRGFFGKLFDKVPTPDDSLSGFENMLETDPDKKFIIGEKGIDKLKEQYKKRIKKRNDPDIKRVDGRSGFQKAFNVIPTPEDSLSGFETVNMGSPADATDKEKLETDAALTSAAKKESPDPPEAKTPLTTLEQELLNRQKQLQKDRDFDRYMALAQAGLSIMSSDKPTLAGAIGEGGTAGLTAFRDAQERYQEGLNDILNARVKLAGKKGGLTQKEAISAISAIDSNIATLRGKIASATDPAIIKEIEDEIAQFNFQKESLMPRAGFSRLSMNVSDSAAK